MPAVRINVVVDDTALRELKQALQESPREFYAAVNNTILPQAQKRLNDTLNKEPRAAVHPFKFATAKSRRYYFATYKGGYSRTGAVRQWRVVLKAFSGRTVEMTFENPAAHAEYVFGPRQVPGHAITGWVNADAVLPALVNEVVVDLAEAWVEVFEDDRKTA